MVDKKTALVLGAGGMYGAYQAGAWTVLQPFFRPDIVVGASAGSLNGWAIASGMPPEQLVKLWLEVGEIGHPRFRIPPGIFGGMLDSAGLEQYVTRLHEQWPPQVPLGVGVTRGWGLKHKLYQNGDITAQHLLASCAVPFVLPARRIDGYLCFDGGLRDALPVWGAVEMGATHIIGIDVWVHLPWWWSVGRSIPYREYPGIKLHVLEPERLLGPLATCAKWNRANAERWIEQGRRDAEKQIISIGQCLESAAG
jgi:NTE family protein